MDFIQELGGHGIKGLDEDRQFAATFFIESGLIIATGNFAADINNTDNGAGHSPRDPSGDYYANDYHD